MIVNILAEFRAEFLQSLFLVLTDVLQLNVFVLKTMELLENPQTPIILQIKFFWTVFFAFPHLFQSVDLQRLSAELCHRVFLSVQIIL